MIPVPSPRLLLAGGILAGASLVVLAFPAAWLPLLTADLLLVALAVIDWAVTPGVGQLEARRLTPERLGVLEEATVALVVRNRSRMALRVRLRDTPPNRVEVLSSAGVSGTGELSSVVPADGEARCEYHIRPQTRGLFTWGSIHLRYRSAMGLWELGRVVPAAAQTRVYPNVAALERYHLLARANRLSTLGIRKVRLRGGAWEFESLREYVDGDDVRLLDWKATARRRKLIVRNHQAEHNQTVLLLLDCGRLMNAEVEGGAKLDHAINSALVLAHVALNRGDRVGLCAFSAKVHTWVTPRSHVGQTRLLAEALYDLRGDFTESDHGDCLRLVAARHQKRALLVVLTDFVDTQTAADMVAHLRQAARRHLVLFLALKDPFLERAVRSLPGTTAEGFRKAAAVDLLHQRREVLERLRRLGMHALDVEPTGITPSLINRYLEITARGQL
jgi:uncharacterized protein (DUF58 family)